MTLAEGFGNTDAGPALAMAGFGALIVAFCLFIPRKVLTFKEFMKAINYNGRRFLDTGIAKAIE